MVIGGHVVDTGDRDLYASNMKSISARLLMLIAVNNKFEVLVGDIGNAYLYAKNALSVYVRLGEEFHVYDKKIKAGSLATVDQNLYGLGTAGAQWHAHLSDTLRQLEFTPTSHDADLWIRSAGKGKGYDYIGTHTDDLMVVAKDAHSIMKQLQQRYTIKKVEEPSFHLGCDYKRDVNGDWFIGTTTYCRESVEKVEAILGLKDGLQGSPKTPMQENLKPEMDESQLLDTAGHRKYQQLIGIGQWLVTCGRIDIAFALSSLSRYSAAPRKGHLDAAVYMFKYVKKHAVKWIKIDPTSHVDPTDSSKKPELEDPTKGKIISWKEQYPDAQEEILTTFPASNGMKGFETTVYFDSNFAHDEKTRRSITSVLGYIGNTPVSCISKRQGAIATSTYSAELCAAKTGAEEAINLRYMIRALGIPCDRPTTLIGDNLGSLISTSNPGTPCKKKQSGVAYHFVRECNAAGIVNIRKIHTSSNLSDAGTKALGATIFSSIINRIFAQPKVQKTSSTKRVRKG